MFRTADGEVAIAPSSGAVYYRLLEARPSCATTRIFAAMMTVSGTAWR